MATEHSIEVDGFGNFLSAANSRELKIFTPVSSVLGSPRSAAPQDGQTSFQEEEEFQNVTKVNYVSDRGEPRGLRRLLCCTVRNCCCLTVTTGVVILVGLFLWNYGPWEKTLGEQQEQTYAFMQCPVGNLTEEDGSVTCCNGLESNCALRVNEVMFATVHNAMSTKADDFLAANNILPMENALEVGYRAFMFDSCSCTSGVKLCHSMCETGTRDPKEVFRNIVAFLRSNPSEIVILEFEVNHKTLDELFEVMMLTDGFIELMYVHPSVRLAWPRMGTLVRYNKRIIVFQHNGPNCWEETCPYGIHQTFDHMFDTPFLMSSISQVLNYDFSCSISRGQWGYKSFFILNHFSKNSLGLPDTDVASKLNERAFLEERIDECEQRVMQSVNLMTVDFWEIGDLPVVTQRRNIERAAEVSADDSTEEIVKEELPVKPVAYVNMQNTSTFAANVSFYPDPSQSAGGNDTSHVYNVSGSMYSAPLQSIDNVLLDPSNSSWHSTLNASISSPFHLSADSDSLSTHNTNIFADSSIPLQTDDMESHTSSTYNVSDSLSLP